MHPFFFVLFSCILEKGASKILVLFYYFFPHDTHHVSPEKRKKVKQLIMLYYKAHKDCGQAQDLLIKSWNLVL